MMLVIIIISAIDTPFIDIRKSDKSKSIVWFYLTFCQDVSAQRPLTPGSEGRAVLCKVLRFLVIFVLFSAFSLME